MKPQAQVKVRCAIYTRVSTVNHKQSVDPQLRDLRPFAQANGWKAVEYEDHTSSSKERPNLDRLMADAKQHKFDVVLVWRFDRFARSTGELDAALRTFNYLGIQFISFMERIDTRTPAGKLVFTVLSAVAEMEKALIHERVCAGLRNAVAKGKQLGRRKGARTKVNAKGLTEKGKHLGRPKGRVKTYDPNLVTLINALRSRTRENPDGLSYREIAKRLDFHHMTVYAIVNQRTQ